jgi:hypothetical protein
MRLHLLLLYKNRKSVQELRKPYAVIAIAASNLFSVVYGNLIGWKADFESAASANSAIPAWDRTIPS